MTHSVGLRLLIDTMLGQTMALRYEQATRR